MLFGKYDSVLESTTVEVTQSVLESVEATNEGFAEIVAESTTHMATLMSGLYLTDIMIESKLADGEITSDEAEALTEGAVSDLVKKSIEKIKKVWAKVKAWFQRALYNIKVTFTKSSTFIEKYEKDIEEALTNKNIKDFKYKGYKYPCATIRYDELQGKIEDALVASTSLVDGSNDTAEDWVKALSSKEGKTGLPAEGPADFWKTANLSWAKDWTEARAELVKEFRGGSEPTEVKFSEMNPRKMLEIAKDFKQIKSECDEAIREIDTEFKKVISALQSADKQIGDSSTTKYISKLISHLNTLLNIDTSMNQLGFTLATEYYKTSVSVFKQIVKSYGKYAKVKESAGVEGSILESAMGMLI